MNIVKHGLIVLKKSTMDAIKTASKKSNSKTEATGDTIGNKIADKITSASKKSLVHSMELYSTELH